jgi:hypothetical protein
MPYVLLKVKSPNIETSDFGHLLKMTSLGSFRNIQSFCSWVFAVSANDDYDRQLVLATPIVI